MYIGKLKEKRKQIKKNIKSNTIAINELQQKVKAAEARNALLTKEAQENAQAIEHYKKVQEEYDLDNREYEAIRDSTITKDKFYDAEPDFFNNDMPDF